MSHEGCYADGTKVTVSYVNASETQDFYAKRRFPIASIQYGKDNTVWEQYAFAYRHNETDITDVQGNTVTYQFNDQGLTTGLVDQTTGTGQYFAYGAPTDPDNANELLKSSKLMTAVTNKIKNPSAGSTANWASLSGVGYTLGVDSATGYIGAGSFKISASAPTANTVWYGQNIADLSPGMYTASCYVTTNGAALSSGSADLWLTAVNSSGEEQRHSQAIGIKRTDAGAWERLVASIEIKDGETLQVKAGTKSQAAGTFWMDDFQVEAGEAPNLYNLLQNTDFDYGDHGWSTPSAMGPGQATVPGITQHAINVSQTAPLSAAEGEKISFGGWGKADSAALKEYGRTNTATFCIKLTFLTSGQSPVGDPVALSFNPTIASWQFLCGEATVPANAAYVKFAYEYNYNINSASFKNGFVYREPFNDTDYTQTDASDPDPYDYAAQKQWTIVQQDENGNSTSTEAFIAAPATTVVSDQIYYIINAATGEALCAPSIDAADALYTHALILGDPIYQWRLHLYDTYFNWYNMYSAGTSTGVSMADADATAEGLPFLHRLIEGMLPQMMKFLYNNDGTFSIVPAISGHYMDCTTAEDQPADTRYSYVRQYAKNTEDPDSQKWILIPVSSVGSQTIKTSSTYSADGQDQLTSTDERGKTTTYSYDHGNGNYHTQYVTEPGRSTIEYIYNSKDYLTEVRSGSVYETNSYNADGQITSIQYDHGATRYAFDYDDRGRPASIDVGNGTLTNRLLTYVYNDQQQLASRTYGNGGASAYQYDRWGNVTHQLVGDHSFIYVYDCRGHLALTKDIANDTRTRYTYDSNDNLLQFVTTSDAAADGGSEKTRVEYTYSSDGTVTTRALYVDGVQKGTYRYQYGSGADENQVQGVNFNNTERLTYTYDDFGRLTNTKINTSTAKNIAYTYLNGAAADKTTNWIAKETFGTGDELVYTYNDSGNITKIANSSGATLRAYTYSSLTGRLLSEENAASGIKTTYSYDDYNGNILSKTSTPLAGGTATTITYAYGNTTGWKDQMTSYNGQAITYDASGNPLTYRDGMTMTWQGGRELTSLSKSGATTTYSYNENSIRTKKVIGSTTTDYYLADNVMVAEKKGSNLITYMFDENGERYGFLYNSTPYYYVRNMQGDVIRILNQYGSIVARYEYDAWGKVLKVTNNAGTVQTASTFIGNINPIRYRGYYYDAETGFYYLQSRYYDPETCRFINADEPEMVVLATDILLAKGLYIYCDNDPINNIDTSGYATISLKTNFFYLDNKYYGGNQSWWEKATFKYLHFFSKKKSDVGCATVAASNVMAYLAKSAGLKKLYPYTYTKSDFLKMMNKMWGYVTPGPAGFWWLSDYVKGVEKYAKNAGVPSLKGVWSDKKPTLANAIQYVKDGLKRNCPVTLVVHSNSKLNVGDINFGWHWVVITSINDKRNKNGNGAVTITVSSWGRKYTLNFRTVINDSSYWGLMYFKW